MVFIYGFSLLLVRFVFYGFASSRPLTCKDASTKEHPTVEKLSRAVARNRVSRCAIFGACVARMDGRTMPRKKARFT